ncbi:hypothetical protein AB0M80_38820 [Amycolatopsis sp. NPDC051045]|uniref:hypothetical protein n=1 Tax=Amycolatopsis sp. NPDC051045 TaxID=3156922 RepID=UPI00341D6F94
MASTRHQADLTAAGTLSAGLGPIPVVAVTTMGYLLVAATLLTALLAHRGVAVRR